MAAFAFGTWRSGRFKTTENSRALPVVALVLALFGAGMGQWYVQYNSVAHDDSDHPEMDDDSRLYEYEPLKEGYGKLPKLAATPSLEIDHDYPRLSGDQALLPVYAAAVNSIYYLDAGYYNRDPRLAALCMHCTTPEAFQSLLDGKSDMIFAAAPTADQKQLAAEAGLSYTLTPIGREALVFMVNDKNAVTGLSTEQLRDVYSGKVTDWQQVGGGAGKILAYQRKPDSASQNVMASAVMRGAPLREPLKIDHFIGRRQGMERRLALYQNLPGALGYTFRFHATKLFASAGTRLLAVDGVEPTADNIRNGSYRLAWDFYIITVRPLSGNAARLRDWFVSDEGQRVIWQVGYVPVKAAGLTPARPWH
jgi:phosphate transport system substrate-binding protein